MSKRSYVRFHEKVARTSFSQQSNQRFSLTSYTYRIETNRSCDSSSFLNKPTTSPPPPLLPANEMYKTIVVGLSLGSFFNWAHGSFKWTHVTFRSPGISRAVSLVDSTLKMIFQILLNQTEIRLHLPFSD